MKKTKILTKINVLGTIWVPFLVKALLTCGALLWLLSLWRSGNAKEEIFVCLILLLAVVILLPLTVRDLLGVVSVGRNGLRVVTEAVDGKREFTSKGIGFEGHDRTDYYLLFVEAGKIPVNRDTFESAEQGDLCYVIEFLGGGGRSFRKSAYLAKNTELSPELDDLLWRH